MGVPPQALSHGGQLELDARDPRDAVAAFLRAAREFPTAGVRTPQGFQTYPQLLARARRMLTEMRALGLRAGDHAVLLGLPLADFFPAFWACVLGGVQPVAIADEPASGPVLDRVRHTWQLLGRPVVITAGATIPDIPTATLREDHPEAADFHDPDELDVALLMLSSGSTGVPKASQLTHRALAEFCAGTRRMLDLRPGDVTMNWLPVDHSGAFLLYHVLPVFLGGANIHLPTDAVVGNPLHWLDVLAEHRVNHTWSPTFGLQLVIDAVATAPERTWDLSALRSLLCGGEQILLPVAEKFLRVTEPFGVTADAFVTAWGMAETTTAITLGRLRSDGGVRRVRKSSLAGELEWVTEDGPETATFVAVGPPAPGATVRVVDTSGNVLPERRIGRLQVAGNRLTTGYVNNPEATAALLPGDGTWLHTGDLAFLADGQVVITGREHDLIVLNGHNVFCHEVEEVAGSVPGVPAGGVGACGVPNPATGSDELVVCYEGASGLESRIREALFTRLRLTARVVAIPVGEFPRTGSGKVRRGALRDRVSAKPDVAAAVHEILGEVDAHKPFYDLGLTSVTLMRLKARLEEELGTSIPAAAMFEHPTVAALTAHVTGRSVERSVSAAPPETDNRIAIIGMSARFPGAPTIDDFWANLRDGVSSVQNFGAAADGVVPVGGVLSDVDSFDAEFFGVPPREAELTDPAHRLFLECAYQALEHSGHVTPDAGTRVGVYAGSGMNLYGHQDRLAAAPDVPTAMRATIGAEPDFLASRVAYRLGLTGPAIGVQTACSTALVAVHLAVQGLLSGDADLALAGAAAVRVPQDTGYQDFPGSILSPTGQCRAFDADADGTVGGNGVAAVVLKRLDRALADGDTVHAVILGTAVNNDGTSKVGFAAPSVSGQVAVVREALRRARVPSSTISYVEAHGTGTRLGDPIEVEALRQAFSDTDQTGFCALGSVKPNIGHLDSCAGLAGLIKTVLMLQHRELVPTINLQRPNPELRLADSPFVLATSRRPWTGSGPLRAGVSALGVGGTNAHIILEEAPVLSTSDCVDPVVLPLSAHSFEDLAVLADRLREHLVQHPALPAADIASTMALGRPHFTCRTAVVGSTATELASALTSLQPSVDGPIVFAFSGQDTAVGDAADKLRAAFPVADTMLAACDSPLAQPQLFAYQAALVEVWRSLGVEPDVVIGHSIGEYAALYAAGALSFADGLRLTTRRGELMQSGTSPGAMVAAMASLPVLQRIASDSGVEIAAVNGAEAAVLSGSEPAIAAAVLLLDAEGLVWRRLGVDRAFHSALLDPILPDLRAAARQIPFAPLRRRMISALDGTQLSAVDADYLCRHAREAVRFDLALAAVDSAALFVEIGPGRVLSGIGRRALPDSNWVQSAGDDRALPTALGEAYRAGAPVNWRAVVNGRRVPLPGYPLRRHQVAAPAPAEVDAGGALDVVRELVARQLGLAVVEPDRSFLELGADSLALMNVVRELDQACGVRVPVRELFEGTNTARKLAARVGEVRPVQPVVVVVPEARPTETRSTPGPEVTEPQLTHQPQLSEPVSAADLGLRSIVEQQLKLMDRQLTLLETAASPAPSFAVPTQAPAPVSPVHTPAPSAPSRAPAPAVPAQRSISPTPTVRPETPAAPLPSTPGCDFSLYFFGDYPDEAAHDKYRLITQAAKFADEHGFHTLWLPERHFHSFGALFPNPSVLAAALAAQTKNVRLHAGSVVLPLHNPLRVVEEWSVVDNLSHGRAGLCVASGWHARDFVLAPENYGRHREELYTRLDTVQKLWAGEAITATAGNGEQVEVRAHPRPVQERPPMFVAVVGNPDSYRKAAEADLGVVTNLMAQSIEELADNIALYRRTRAEHGLDPAAGRVVVLVHTYLGQDLETVRAEAFAPFCDYLRSSLSLFGQVTNSLGLNIDLDDTPEEDVAFLLQQAYQRYCDSRALIGTAESCGKVVDGLLAAGADEIACFVDFGVDADKVLNGLSTLDSFRQRFTQEAARPATAAERRIWFLEQLHPGQSTYHEPKAIRLEGSLDVGALRGSLRKVIARHPALRSVFREVDGVPHRITLPDVDVECPVVDAAGRAEDEVLREVMRTDGRQVFDLSDGPLLLARLLRFSPDHHVLFLLAHHIVFDSASTVVLLNDLAAHYRAWPADAALPAVREIAVPQEDPEGDIRFWRDRLADAPELALPTDRPRPAVRTGAGAGFSHELGADLTAHVQRLARAQEVTPFTVLLSAFAGVLARFSGQEDLVIGTGVAGRPHGAENTIGMFVDTVPLRLDLSGDPEFGRLARHAAESTMDAFTHRAASFDELVTALNPARDPGRNPLFQVAIEYENAGAVSFDPPRLAATPIDMPSDRAPLDLVLYLTHAGDHVRCAVEYDTALFDESTIRRLLAYFEHTLRSVTPTTRLSEVDLITADIELLQKMEGIPAAVPTACLHELVEQQDPQAVALVWPDGEMTYQQLDRRANDIANRLIERGVTRGDLVGVCLPRHPDYIAAVLGVLKSGAAFLPLDPALPADRRQFMMTDSAATALVTNHAQPPLADVPTIYTEDIGESAVRPGNGNPDDLAYCIYTSGSTGRPKGVLVPHRGVVNLVGWHRENHPPTRTLQWSSPAFDGHVFDIFTTLGSGATLVLIDDETRYDPAAVAEVIRAQQVERLVMPFTPLLHLMSAKPALPSLREIVSAGEATIPTPAVHEFMAAHPNCALYNTYGPTEGSIAATEHRVGPGENRPPIGRPVAGVQVRLLDAHQRPVPVGAVGEIYLDGPCVADGYRGRPVEHAAAFVAPRRYKTGDLGRWRADGALEFHGRTDDQVKIRGNRIEPGEIRHALLQLPEVRDAAVLVRDGELVGYVVTEEDPASLGKQLAESLPAALVPRRWVRLPQLPMTVNGKLDHARLPEAAPLPSTPPATAAERAVHAVWCKEFGRDDLGVDESFFELGGHSLTMVRLLKQCNAQTGLDLSMADFMLDPTIRGMAAKLDTAPLTCAQRRLWQRHHVRADASVYNGLFRIDITGALNPARLQDALTELVRRHAAFRTQVFETHQQVLPPSPFTLPITDLTEAQADQWCADQSRQPFDLSTAPLFRANLGRISHDRWVFTFVAHHMIFDGWSTHVFWQELSALYRGDQLPPPSAQYPDYAHAEHTTLAHSDDLRAFWRKELDGATLRPALPCDHPRPATLSGAGATVHRSTSATRVRAEAAAEGTTPHVIIARSFARWLSDVCGQDDVVLATSSARRDDPEYDSMIGYVGEAVLVRVQAGDDIATRLYTALDHQALPLSEVVRAALPHEADTPYPAVLFTVVTTPPHAVDLGAGLTTRVSGYPARGQARTELYVVFTLAEDELSLDIEYSTDLFTEDTVNAWADALLPVEVHVAPLVLGA